MKYIILIGLFLTGCGSCQSFDNEPVVTLDSNSPIAISNCNAACKKKFGDKASCSLVDNGIVDNGNRIYYCK
jgi:hypothetical protein